MLEELEGFPDSSVGEESACNAGDPSSIPGSGRPAGEGIGHPLQYSWASLVVKLVKNPPAMQKTWVRSLGWKGSPGEGNSYPLQYSALENSMDCIIHRVTKSWTRLSEFHFQPDEVRIIIFLSQRIIPKIREVMSLVQGFTAGK